MIESRAAVLREAGAPLVVETIEWDEPRADEVVVKVAAAALCHSDLIRLKSPRTPVPMVAGHEAAGVVESVGSAVSGLTVGDKVLFSFIPSCGRCHYCARGMRVDCTRGMGFTGLPLDGTSRAHTKDGLALRQMARLGAFSERVVVHQDSCLRVPADTNLRAAALLSCGFTTGAGAAINAARADIGDTVVVVGTGGVGTAAIQGAVAAGAGRIIAIDIHDEKLASAKIFGATDLINARTTPDWAAQVLELTGGFGADSALLCVGNGTAAQIADLMRAIRTGGTAVVVGATIGLDEVVLNPADFSSRHKTLTGSIYGSADPGRDQLHFLDLYRAGRLKVEEMVTRTYLLDDVAQAIADLQDGRNIRGLIEL